MGRVVINMSDDEYAVDAGADAGASATYPLEAGQIRKGGYIVIKNRPCKVVDVSTAKKLEELCPSSHNATVPFVSRVDYQVMDIESAAPGEPISLMDQETAEITDAYNLPPDADLCAKVMENFESGEDTFVTVIEAMGESQIISV